MLKSIKISLTRASDWSTAIKIVVNIDESGFRCPIYPMLKTIKISVWKLTWTITFKINCIPDLTQIMGFQFKYPGLWLVNANLNNGISTQNIPNFKINCISCLTQIRELQFKYPDLWLVNADLNNGISTQNIPNRISTQNIPNPQN